jgi:hypothetical protein
MMNRFDLEDAISRMLDTNNELDDLIYKVGDCPEKPDEDEILNMLIGIKSLNESRYSRMWMIFEQLIKDETIRSETEQIPSV